MQNESSDRVLTAAELSRVYLPTRTPATICKDLSRRPHTLPPAIRVPGCHAYWLESTVVAWLKAHQTPAPAGLPPRRRGRPTKAEQLACARAGSDHEQIGTAMVENYNQTGRQFNSPQRGAE